MKIIGIDYGTQKVGIAISDDEGKLAFPVSTVATGEALDYLDLLAKEKKADTVVVGESQDPPPVATNA